MASNSSSDFDGSSDTVYDAPCKPCSEDDKSVEAACFCVQCKTFFCETCIGHHNKCFKAHTLFHKSLAKIGSQEKLADSTCDKHPGNPVQMYCGEHDTVSCAVCIAVDHRLCKSVDYIPKLAMEVLNGRDKKGMKTSLENLKRELKAVKATKLEEIERVNMEKEGIVSDLAHMKERLIEKVKQLEQISVTEVQRRYDKIVKRIRNDLKYLDELLENTDGQVMKIDSYKGNNQAKLFIIVNKAHETELECTKYLETSSKTVYDQLSFLINNDIESALNNMEAHGFAKETNVYLPGIEPAVSNVTLMGDFDIKCSYDSNNSLIRDCCMLDDGDIILLDAINHLIKRLDKTYKLKDWCSILHPVSVCTTGPDELAVAQSDAIQFVHIGRSMVPTKSLEMSEYYMKEKVISPSIPGYNPCKISLQQVVYNKKKLYIGATLVYKKGNTFYTVERYVVFVTRKDGKYIQTIDTGILKEKMGHVYHFTTSLDCSCLYFATGENGLIILESNGSLISEVMDDRLQRIIHIDTGKRGQIYVCRKDTGNVFLLDKHGKVVHEVLGRYDGIRSPSSILYIEHLNRLLVACECQCTVKVYQLK